MRSHNYAGHFREKIVDQSNSSSKIVVIMRPCRLRRGQRFSTRKQSVPMRYVSRTFEWSTRLHFPHCSTAPPAIDRICARVRPRCADNMPGAYSSNRRTSPLMPATPPGPGWAETPSPDCAASDAPPVQRSHPLYPSWFSSGDEMRRLLTRPLSAPRTGFHDARIFPVGDPQSVMELYGSNDGFLRDSGRTRRGPPKALRASDVSGDDTRLFGACDVADTRSERGPMARAETPDAPILEIDPQDVKKVKGVKAGARARARDERDHLSSPQPASGLPRAVEGQICVFPGTFTFARPT